MYLDRAGSKSRYNLSYDQAAGAYLANVSEVCGPVELTVYGRVGERSAMQTVQVECGTCGAAAAEAASNRPPEMIGLVAEPISPQEAGTAITCTAEATDPDGDQILYRFIVNDGPTTDWQAQNQWSWNASDAGTYRIEDLADLNSLTANQSDIKDLTGLEHCKGLQYLDLGSNQITDVSPLSVLTNLNIDSSA